MSLTPEAFGRLENLAKGPPPEDDGPPVETIGRYRLIREIARGAIGIVYLAEDSELRRHVALKVLQDFAGSSELARKRFQREAQAAGTLSHPNVIQVHDAGEQRGRLYLAMEYVDGPPLSEVLGSRRLDRQPLVKLLEKVARGVAAAHAAGIVHRDLKPANILVVASGEPKVGDFGLAHWGQDATALTRTGTPMGTPVYMSPEQVRGDVDRIGPATDVYALGAILYEILTGRPPHVGDSTVAVYTRILGDEPASPRRLGTRTPVELEVICLKALEKEPSKRYPTAAQFADDLARHIAGEPILARPPGPIAAAIKWTRRHRVASVAAGVALAGIVAVAATRIRAGMERRDDVARYNAAGRAAMASYRRLEGDLAGLLPKERTLAAELGWTPDEKAREPLVQLRSEIRAKEEGLGLQAAAAIRAFSSARGIDPDDADAKAALVGLGYAEYERAEKSGDRRGMEVNKAQVLAVDPGGAWRFVREGTLSIESVPPGAQVEVLRYVEAIDRRLVAEWQLVLGPCPVAKTTLPAGSYLLILRLMGFRDIRYPVLIEHQTDQTARVRFYRDADIGEGYVYVPEGPYIAGGDPAASMPRERTRATTAGFFIARCEVTLGEYLVFLNETIRHVGPVEARKRAPTSPGLGLEIPDDAARVTLPDTWDPSWPVFGIAGAAAAEYARWRTEIARQDNEGVTYRLPTVEEYEKAARGADGRFFPWGNEFTPGFATIGRSDGVITFPAPVGSSPKDESPYGIRDLAGNAMEWTSSWWRERTKIAYLCGGSWNNPMPIYARSASRSWDSVLQPSTPNGFRLVRVPVH